MSGASWSWSPGPLKRSGADPAHLYSFTYSDAIRCYIERVVEVVDLLGASTVVAALLAVAVLLTSLSRCPDCGSLATRPVEAMGQGIRVCKTCFNIYKA